MRVAPICTIVEFVGGFARFRSKLTSAGNTGVGRSNDGGRTSVADVISAQREYKNGQRRRTEVPVSSGSAESALESY